MQRRKERWPRRKTHVSQFLNNSKQRYIWLGQVFKPVHKVIKTCWCSSASSHSFSHQMRAGRLSYAWPRRPSREPRHRAAGWRERGDHKEHRLPPALPGFKSSVTMQLSLVTEPHFLQPSNGWHYLTCRLHKSSAREGACWPGYRTRAQSKYSPVGIHGGGN